MSSLLKEKKFRWTSSYATAQRFCYASMTSPDHAVEGHASPSPEVLAPGSRMSQEIYEDEFGLNAWGDV